LRKTIRADRKGESVLIGKEFCCLTKQLAHKFCPRTIRRRVSPNDKFQVCTYHNMRHDIDHLYIHYLMNKYYKKDGRYQIMDAIRWDSWLRLVYGTGNKGGDYPALQKLLRKLDRSDLIKRRIRVIEPKPRHTRDYYGNYKAYFPDERRSSRLYHELRRLLLDGGEFTPKIRRELSRKYHETAEIIQFCYEWARQDLERYSPEELRILKDLEQGGRTKITAKKLVRKNNK